MTDYVIAVDQGTTSTRAIVFDAAGVPVGGGQREHEQVFPRPGWVEHSPQQIWQNTKAVIREAVDDSGVAPAEIRALGIANQTETTVVWDRHTGEPVYNAIVWQDTRTQDLVDRLAADGVPDRFAERVGSPLSAYFAATKIRWVLDQVPGARRRAERGDLLYGSVDSWLTWNLTGGVHITDVTNASRTLLMDLRRLAWDDELLAYFDLPTAMLPEIGSCGRLHATVRAELPIDGVPVAGIMGDQRAATFGQAAFEAGEAKNTYGTGNFLIVNTGTEIVHSQGGMLTTVVYQLGDEPARYGLEGSIAVTGSLVHWMRDNLGLITSSAEVEALAGTVEDNGGVYFVPAFSGLYAPYWRSDARGAILGLTHYATKAHLARAAVEAAAFQTAAVVESVRRDTGIELTELKVDGGMAVNESLMQFQADLIGVPVLRPAMTETTALGVAYAAGLTVGVWRDRAELRAAWRAARRWTPTMDRAERDRLYRAWNKAVEHASGWLDDDTRVW